VSALQERPKDYAKWSREKQDEWCEQHGLTQEWRTPRQNGEAAEPALPPEFTEDRLALDFAEKHSPELRYVAAWGKWLAWTGTHWEFENTLAVFDLARKICRAAATRCNKPAESKMLAKAKTVAAVEMLARSDRRIAATKDQWGIDQRLLNTPDGTIDLKTGQMRPHRQDDYMIKITAVGPGGTCPQFLEFLATITNSNADLMDYIQRVFGYALTGDTREHALFFLHGTGANGKSVLVSTFAGILGSYHRTAPIETFVASSVSSHPTDLAGLMGARLVTAVETEEGRRWAESKIKALTGGDQISARFMRQDFFEFTRFSNSSSPAITSQDCAASTKQFGAASTLSLSPSPSRRNSATRI